MAVQDWYPILPFSNISIYSVFISPSTFCSVAKTKSKHRLIDAMEHFLTGQYRFFKCFASQNDNEHEVAGN